MLSPISFYPFWHSLSGPSLILFATTIAAAAPTIRSDSPCLESKEKWAYLSPFSPSQTALNVSFMHDLLIFSVDWPWLIMPSFFFFFLKVMWPRLVANKFLRKRFSSNSFVADFPCNYGALLQIPAIGDPESLVSKPIFDQKETPTYK